MVRPGATIKKPRVKFLLVGRRTALTVCHAISIAMTVVLPPPCRTLAQLPSTKWRFRRPQSGNKWPDVVEGMMPPVLQQPCGFRADLPFIEIRQSAPDIHMAAQFADDGSRIVLLALRRRTNALVEKKMIADGQPLSVS